MVQGCYVTSQDPVVTKDSEPEPDVSVIRGKLEDYKTEQPSSRVPPWLPKFPIPRWPTTAA